MRELLLEAVGLPAKELVGEDSAEAARVLARADGAGPVAFRGHSLPDGGRRMVSALDEVPIRQAALHLLQGSLRGTLRADADLESLAPISKAARAHGGSLRIVRADRRVPEGIEVGETLTGALARLHAGITAEFDPGGILPGAWREDWA
jgi:hypothetical protein